ncbi:hypothetical protein GCM10009827_059810 [Dactylosporangium maewongense]|uniref:Transposase n=1 Tax=Dactylosporangium maewongense TaxID=634393 RepID=A0ABN2B4Y3_9ACTN
MNWRALPADFPPWRTVVGFLARWSDDLSTITLTDRLRAELRAAVGRHPQPAAGCDGRSHGRRVAFLDGG